MLKYKLSFIEYFILHCIQTNKQNLLEDYVYVNGIFDKGIFDKLIKIGYLNEINSSITYDVLKLKPKYYDDFQLTNKLEHQKYFEELQEIYPRKVKGRASLHTNLANCRKKYQEIVDSEAKHKLVLECTLLYINDLTKAGKLEFIQALPAYLNQRTYEGYIEDVEKGISVKDIEKDNKTNKGAEYF